MTRGNRPFSPRTQAHALRACARAVLLQLGLLAGLGLVLPGPVRAADGPLRDEVEDLADLSLEQLAEIEVMSVSRRLERLSEVLALRYPRENLRKLREALRKGARRTQAAARELAVNVLDASARTLMLALAAPTDQERLAVLYEGRASMSLNAAAEGVRGVRGVRAVLDLPVRHSLEES